MFRALGLGFRVCVILQGPKYPSIRGLGTKIRSFYSILDSETQNLGSWTLRGRILGLYRRYREYRGYHEDLSLHSRVRSNEYLLYLVPGLPDSASRIQGLGFKVYNPKP